MKVKPSKCEFHQNETEYLECIIGQDGVKTDPVRTEAIWDWTTPNKIMEIQCFLGFCNFYRRFIERFGRTAKPLYAKTKKECIGNWEWGGKEQQAFAELRTKLTRAPVLVYFNPLARTKIETDASKYVCSGILSEQPNARTGNGDQWHTDPKQCRTRNATTTYTPRYYWQ